MKRLLDKTIAAGALGFVLGIVIFIGLRFVFLPVDAVHYHANFAVFINGKREAFAGSQYYQEIASCNQNTTPQGRVHMHANINHIIHVHDGVQTWAQFFNNLGWSLGDTLLSDGSSVYQDQSGGKLSFILNGLPVRSIADEIIKDKDRLLISFSNNGTTDPQQEFSQVESDAAQYDASKDPAACAGPEKVSWQARLRRAAWF
jgi:hypothetical protein